MTLHNSPWLVVIIPLALNYLTLKEQNIVGSVVAQDYRNGDLHDSTMIGVDGLMFVQLLFMTLFAYLLLCLKRLNNRNFNQSQIQKSIKDSSYYLWQEILLGFFWFLNIKFLSQVQITHQSTILVMFIKNLNLIPVLIFINYFLDKDKNKKDDQKKINYELSNQKHSCFCLSKEDKFFSGFKVFLLVMILSAVSTNLCLQDFVNHILPQDYPSFQTFIGTFFNGQFLLAVLADFGMFGTMFWLKRKCGGQINPLKMLIHMTKFSAIFFGISSFLNGQLSDILTEMINYSKLVESLMSLSILKFAVYLIICYCMITYPPTIFFALYSTRRTFHKAQEFMIDKIELRSISFFIAFFVLMLLIFQFVYHFKKSPISLHQNQQRIQYQIISHETSEELVNLSSIKLQKEDS